MYSPEHSFNKMFQSSASVSYTLCLFFCNCNFYTPGFYTQKGNQSTLAGGRLPDPRESSINRE